MTFGKVGVVVVVVVVVAVVVVAAAGWTGSSKYSPDGHSTYTRV